MGARAIHGRYASVQDEDPADPDTPSVFPHTPENWWCKRGACGSGLDALGKPTEILYFATASHSTTRPQHRLRSLGTHIDWWRFWLEDQEDPVPGKKAQYAHWRTLRERQANPDSGSRRP